MSGKLQRIELTEKEVAVLELRKAGWTFERIAVLFGAMYEVAVTKGSARHAEVALRAMERRARLLGLDAPTRQAVNVITDDAIDAEIKRLEAELAASDP